MAKILMIVAQKDFRDEELFVPKKMLEQAGHDVLVASVNRTKATGMKGGVVEPDMAIYEANADFFNAVIVVGGSGSPTLAGREEMNNLLTSAQKKGRLIAAICLGPLSLGAAGLLYGKNATIFPDRRAIAQIRADGATYLMQPVVEDGKIITADTPENAAEFGKALIAHLKK